MAITTLDGALAGMNLPVNYYKVGPAAKAAGSWISFWRAAGFPASASAPTAASAGQALTASVMGAFPFTDPTSGNSYLAKYTYQSTQIGIAVLADRLWHNANISPSTTGTQSWVAATLPSRDMNGSNLGSGCMIALEYGVAAGNAATNAGVLYYTNSAGTAGRVASWTGVASALLMQWVPCTLQAGDTGVRTVDAIVLQVSNTGASINIVVYRPLAYVPVTLANTGNGVDPITGGFVQMYNGSVPFVVAQAGATTAPTVAGQMIVTQG